MTICINTECREYLSVPNNRRNCRAYSLFELNAGACSSYVGSLVKEKDDNGLTKTQVLISNTCDNLKTMLIDKNKRYGNSAIDPVRIFSTSETDEQLNVRIDDKLSRLVTLESDTDGYWDAVDDLIGYLILKKIKKLMTERDIKV